MSATPEKKVREDVQAFSLRIPVSLVQEIDRRANEFDRTRTSEILHLIKAGIAAKQAGFIAKDD